MRRKGIKQTRSREADLHGIQIATVSHIGSREAQQDAFGISDYRNEMPVKEKGILAILSDGMGGLSGGESASITAVSVCQEYFKSAPMTDAPWQELLRMTVQANRNVLQMSRSSCGQAGATLICAYLKPEGLYFVSVGDSRICLLRAGGLINLNRAHVFARTLDTEEAFGRRDSNEAQTHPERAALSSYIGMEELTQIDFNMTAVRLLRGDTVLLMSDGVFNTLQEAEITAVLSGKNPEEELALMQQMILQKGKPAQDNFTALALQL